MSAHPVSVTSRKAVTHITIDRREKLNALNRQVIAGLEDAFEGAANDDRCRVVVVSGAGDRAFVAGADIGELQGLDPEAAYAFVRRGHALMGAIEQLGKPVIAALNGFALGGGCELALACSLRIASETARLGLPEVKLGLIPGYGGTQRLARLVGRGRALHMMLTGEPVTAETAASWGLVNEVVPASELAERVAALADSLAAGAPLAQRAILNAVHRGADLPFADGIDEEVEQFATVCASEDMQEGTSAFLDKRAPRFSGR